MAVAIFVVLTQIFPPRVGLTRTRLELAQYLHRLGSQATYEIRIQNGSASPSDAGDHMNHAAIQADPVIDFVTGGRSKGFYYRVLEVRLRNTGEWIAPSQFDQPIPVIFPEYVFRHADRFGHVPAYYSDGTVRDCISPLVLAAIKGGSSSNELPIAVSEGAPYSVWIDRLRVAYLKDHVNGR